MSISPYPLCVPGMFMHLRRGRPRREREVVKVCARPVYTGTRRRWTVLISSLGGGLMFVNPSRLVPAFDARWYA
jgi:hypothetical protein